MHRPDDECIKYVAKYIAGEIVLSSSPGKVIRKWRELLEIPQVDLAARMRTSSSVLSDYEAGRRKSPGAQFIRKLVKSMTEIALERRRDRIQLLLRQLCPDVTFWSAVYDLRDLEEPVEFNDFVNAIAGEVIVEPVIRTLIYGYTIVDSMKLILDVPPHEYFRLYSITTQRAAIFANVEHGRSPLVAIKVFLSFSNIRPSVVVLHGISEPDRIGVEIARREKIPLVITKMDLTSMIRNLRKFK